MAEEIIKIHIGKIPMSDGYGMFLIKRIGRWNENDIQVSTFSWRKKDQGDLILPDEKVCLLKDDLQALAEELWALGIRPLAAGEYEEVVKVMKDDLDYHKGIEDRMLRKVLGEGRKNG